MRPVAETPAQAPFGRLDRPDRRCKPVVINSPYDGTCTVISGPSDRGVFALLRRSGRVRRAETGRLRCMGAPTGAAVREVYNLGDLSSRRANIAKTWHL